MPQQLIKPFAAQAARSMRTVQYGSVVLTVVVQLLAWAWARSKQQQAKMLADSLRLNGFKA
jgi:hypothetical protein